MKKMFLCVVLGALMAMPLVYAQAPDLNVTGAGARAMGMGGAFVGVADDATAAYFNPAGLAQLKRPEITLVGFMGKQDLAWTYSDSNEVDLGETGTSYWALNFGSIVVPLNPDGNNIILAASTHMVIDLNREWSLPSSDGSTDGYLTAKDKGGVYAYSAIIGYELNKYLMLGGGVSFYRGGQESSAVFTAKPEDGGASQALASRTADASSGPQFIGGVLAKLTRQLKLGASFRSKTSMDWSETEEGYESHEVEIDVPMSLLSGISYRPHDSLTLALDYHLAKWGDSEMRDAATGAVKTGSEEEEFADSGQLHLGMEYLLSTGGYPIPLRLGFYRYPMSTASFFKAYVAGQFRDESTGERVYKADIGERDYFTGGAGIVLADVVFDVAVEYSPLEEEIVIQDVVLTNEDTKLKVYFSGIYKF